MENKEQTSPSDISLIHLVIKQPNPKSKSTDLSSSMNISVDSVENIVLITSEDSPNRLLVSLTAIKRMTRSKEKEKERHYSGHEASFEEKRWRAMNQEEFIYEEAKKAWEVGKKLGLLSKFRMRRWLCKLKVWKERIELRHKEGSLRPSQVWNQVFNENFKF